MNRVKKALRLLLFEPNKIIRILGKYKIFNWLPDKYYLKLIYKAETGNRLNLDKPMLYNEKLQWIKLYDRKPEYIIYADKYAVRKYIKEKVGEQYLIPLIQVYAKAEDIVWDDLPEQFVLKCNHGSGTNIICKDKSKINVEECKKKLNKWMKRSWYWAGREWAYKSINPKIICEKYLENQNGETLVDYKFMCFNSIPKMIQVHRNRFQESYTKTYYTNGWVRTDIMQGVPNSSVPENKPYNYQLMLEISQVLSKNTFFSRIDFYEHGKELKFGEITLYPNSGFLPFNKFEYDLKLGNWIVLPETSSNNC